MEKKSGRRILLSFLLTAALASGAFAAGAGNAAVSDGNSAPVAKNIECATFRGIAVYGTFEASDADGDCVTFAITTQPKHGTAEMSGEYGFIYTPTSRCKSDSFTYTASDDKGAISNEAVVTVTVKRHSSGVSYSDMEGNPAHYAALRLADEGIFTGDTIGADCFFRPDETVSRGEFLAMCMNVCNSPALDGVSATGFSDDGELPAWVKPYAASALKNGDIKGCGTESGVIFAADKPVTFAEAAVMLNNLLETTDSVSASAVSDSDTCPVWAYQAAVNLSAAGVLQSADDYSAPITRERAAVLLSNAMDTIEARQTGGLFALLK